MILQNSPKIIIFTVLFVGIISLPGVVRALSLDIIVSDSSSESLAVYNAETGALLLNTHVEGPFSYGMSAKSFVAGDFVLIKTLDPDQCAQLTLNECRSSPYFVREVRFSIKPDLLDDNEAKPPVQTVETTKKETSTTSTISTNATGIIPLIIKGVLDFFGINTTTTSTITSATDATVATSTAAPVPEISSSPIETATATPVSSVATTETVVTPSSNETTNPLFDVGIEPTSPASSSHPRALTIGILILALGCLVVVLRRRG